MNRMRVLGLILVSAGALAISLQATGHHSYAATYVMDRKIEIQGEIAVFMYRNPHSILQVVVAGPDGKNVRWACEWAGTRALSKGGINNVTLKPGDKVIITGLPGRNPDVKRLLVTGIQRPSDGWKWSGDSST